MGNTLQEISQDTPQGIKRDLQEETRFFPISKFYDTAADISHEYLFADGDVIGIENAGNYDLYMFRRTNENKVNGGIFHFISTTNGALTTDGWSV